MEWKSKRGFFLLFVVFLLLAGCGGKSSSPVSTKKEEIEIPSVIKQLNSPYLSTRNQALEEIKKNAQLYIPILKNILLHHDLWYRRALAAKALGRMEGIAQEAVFELTQALDDSDLYVQAVNSWALGKIGHPLPQTISKLISLLKNTKDPNERNADGDYNVRKDKDVVLRQNAALALGRLALYAQDAAHPLISTFLYDPNPRVRLNAALALEKIAPHVRCDHISIAQTIQEISNRIYLYASLCFRSEHSLEEGASSKEIFDYYKELGQKFISKNFDWEKDTIPSHASLTAERKYSNQAILACAQRNFSYVSSLDKQWFQIFDRYGYTKEEFKPFQNDWLHTPLISVANTHPLAVSHGKILFEFAQFFSDQQKTIPTLLVEHRYANDSDVKEYYDDLREDFQSHPTLAHTDPLSYVQELEKIKTMDTDTTLASSLLLDSPRSRVEETYALTYPSAEIIPVDMGEERINNACGVRLSTLQDLIDYRDPQETFLLFYGSAHIARIGTNDSSEIEGKVHCNNIPLKTFTIGQFSNPTALLEKTLDLSLLYEAQRIPIEKFSFPKKGAVTSDIDDFLEYWERVVDKYNSRRSNPHVPLYVYLAQAQKHNSLSFFNSIAPYDLFLIPAVSNPSQAGDIQKDTVYLFLKEYLERHIKKLSWISS